MLSFQCIPVTTFGQNCRVMWDSTSQSAPSVVVIDPGGDVPQILQFLASRKLTLHEIWLTHAHLDHCGGVRALQKATGAKLYAHPGEREMRAQVVDIMRMYGLDEAMESCPEPDVYLHGGESLTLGSYTFDVRFVPGHAPGHLAFYCAQEGLILSGDTLFAGSIGRTDFPGCDHQTLIESIATQILTLPDDTKVLAGHGPDTTVGRERRSNPFLVSQHIR